MDEYHLAITATAPLFGRSVDLYLLHVESLCQAAVLYLLIMPRQGLKCGVSKIVFLKVNVQISDLGSRWQSHRRRPQIAGEVIY